MCSWSTGMKFISRSSYHQEAGLIVSCTIMLSFLKEIVSQALCIQLCLQSLYKYDHHFIQYFAGNYSCMPSGQAGFNGSLTVIWRTISWAGFPIDLEISRRLLRLRPLPVSIYHHKDTFMDCIAFLTILATLHLFLFLGKIFCF